MIEFFKSAAFATAVLAAAGCEAARLPDGSGGVFPAADRPVAHIVSPRWSTEGERDRRGEAAQVIDNAGVKPGMTVADIGAGEGYYTVRLARRIGAGGQVLAEDIDAGTRDALAHRISRERLTNVRVILGKPADPRMPENSADRVFLVHMYHEIEQPYEFLWRLRPALRRAGEVIVVDADRATQDHGTPPALLRCEFARVGYRQIAFEAVPAAGGYVARFQSVGIRPEPQP